MASLRLSPRISAGVSTTGLSLLALALGIVVGLAERESGSPAVAALRSVLSPVAELWLNALQMSVLPFVLAYLLAAITGVANGRQIGALGARTVAFFIAMLVATGVFTLLVAPLLVGMYDVDAATVAGLTAGAQVPEAAREAAAAGASSSGGAWLPALLPRNLFAAAGRGDLLPLLIFTVLFGLAASRLPDDQRDTIATFATATSRTMMTIVGWVLLFTPIAIFEFALGMATGAGTAVVGMLGAYVALQCGLLLLVTALLYPLTAVAGRTSIGAFARAVLPAQLVAIGTRSSIAALPATITGATTVLRLPATATSFTLPMSVSLYKLNRVVSSPFKLLFLAHVYGIALSTEALVGFLLAVILLSFSSVGLPGGGAAFKTLPVYLSLGIPIEGLILAEAVETIPDLFKTILNVTANMNAATVLANGERAEPALAALPVADGHSRAA